MTSPDLDYSDFAFDLAEKLDTACMWIGSVAMPRTNRQRLYELKALWVFEQQGDDD